MQYKEFPPPDSLLGWAENSWIFEIDAIEPESDHVIVPDGTVSLSCAILPGLAPMLALVGPAKQAHRRPVTPGAVYCGMRLRPGTAGSLLSRDIRSVAGRFVPLAELFPQLASDLAGRLPAGSAGVDAVAVLGEALSGLAQMADPVDMPVADYCRQIIDAQGDLVLKTVAENASLGERQLRRRFLYQCGLTAKEFARLRRVRHACADMVLEKGSPAAASNRAGFADQAHMSREFRHVFGSSQRMVTDYLESIRHLELAG